MIIISILYRNFSGATSLIFLGHSLKMRDFACLDLSIRSSTSDLGYSAEKLVSTVR